MPDQDRERSRKLRHPQTHGKQPDPKGAGQGFPASQTHDSVVGRRLPRKPRQSMNSFTRFPWPEPAIVGRSLGCKLASRQATRIFQENPMRPLEFGWYLPTHGDTTAYGLMEAQIPGTPELCERVVAAAEKAGFAYLL